MPSPLTLQAGFLPEHRLVAIEIYLQAFGLKLEPLLEPQPGLSEWLSPHLNPRAAFVAKRGDALLGILGVNFRGQRLLGLGTRDVLMRYGLANGVLKLLKLALLERTPAAHELLLDGVAVHSEARGMGVGSALLGLADAFARSQNLTTVRLDVVNNNPRARELYERLGFVASRTSSVPDWASFLPFSSSTTMVKNV